MIDVACPFDTIFIEKENEKIEKYQDLGNEIRRIWHCRDVQIIPVVIDALRTVPKRFDNWVNKIEIDVNFILLQKACLLKTARILRKVLDSCMRLWEKFPEKYQELRWEVARLWKMNKVEVIPVVVGASGTIYK